MQTTRTKPTLEDLSKLRDIDIKGPINLVGQETIVNPNKMVDSHLKTLEAVKDKPRHIKERIGMPMYDRLVALYNKLNL